MRRAATTSAAAARVMRGPPRPSCCCRRSSPSSTSPGCQTWYDRALLLVSHRVLHVYLGVLLAGLKRGYTHSWTAGHNSSSTAVTQRIP